MIRRLDAMVLRGPFGARAARRYTEQRVGFGDLDRRLVASLQSELDAAQVVVDVGAGNGELASAIAGACGAMVIAVEPSGAFGPARGATTVRAVGEALPIATGAVDVAVCLSALRHMNDRRAALRELRRVVRPGGVAAIVEVDPESSRARRKRHTRAMRSRTARIAFEWVVLRACPPASHFAAEASAAGWSEVTWEADVEQPVYVMRLAG